VLALAGAVGESLFLPRGPVDLVLSPGDFVLIETPGTRRGAAFANLCAGLVPLSSGSVRFLDRDWVAMPAVHAQALRGHIGRLFHQRLPADTPNVAARVLLARLHHTRTPEPVLRDQAAALAQHFGLPGLPMGSARLMSEKDLLRAAAVRAFLDEPRLLMLELPPAAQEDGFLSALLTAGTDARRRGAAVMWLAGVGPALRTRAAMPTQRLRIGDYGLTTLAGGRKL
jgi:phospholipid/cholesterol/gamma-HCH transport system ATP-binding protein